SAGNRADESALCEAVQAVIKRFPGADEFSLTVADYDIVDCAERVSADRIVSAFKEYMSIHKDRRKGGFAGNRALRHVLLESGTAEDRYPCAVVITPDGGMLSGDDMTYFTRLVPDIDGYMVTSDGVRFESIGFIGKSVPVLRHYPVREITSGSGVRAFFRADAVDHMVTVDGRTDSVKRGEAMSFGACGNVNTSELAKNALFESAFESFAYKIRAVKNPSLTNECVAALVESGRRTGVLNAATSYIVVEKPSQWKMLEEKESEKLKGKNYLEHSETVRSPEPSSIMICVIAGAIAGIVYMVRRRRSNVSCR
ncbi:MAG TPA: hypothetical protein PKK43_09905, partial [Spirochaetota bacterium]|nr:hypothetical protein [Spirochaetota bacterium]